MPYKHNGTYYADCDECEWTTEADDRRDAQDASARHIDAAHAEPERTYADRMNDWWEAYRAGDPTA